DFLKLAKEKMKLVDMDPKLMERAVNAGFSGGEKKRSEIFQMAVLEPKLCVLDETDSGLDIDALRVVAEGVNALRSPERSMVLITHYQRLLNYVKPDFVHVLQSGRIVESGGPELALKLEAEGYAQWPEGNVEVARGATPSPPTAPRSSASPTPPPPIAAASLGSPRSGR